MGFTTGDLRGGDGADGSDGESAYEIWLNNGNTGTEVDFLNSLVGQAGTDGNDGADGTNGVGFTGGFYNTSTGQVTFTSDDGLGFTTADLRGTNGNDGLDGQDGLSAYEIWINEGNSGTPQDFLASLKGNDGADGTNGINGANGQDGEQGPPGPPGPSAVSVDPDNQATLGTDNLVYVPPGVDPDEAGAIAAGSTLGLLIRIGF